MHFSFRKHDNLNDIRYYLLPLNLENRVLYIISQIHFLQHPWIHVCRITAL